MTQIKVPSFPIHAWPASKSEMAHLAPQHKVHEGRKVSRPVANWPPILIRVGDTSADILNRRIFETLHKGRNRIKACELVVRAHCEQNSPRSPGNSFVNGVKYPVIRLRHQEILRDQMAAYFVRKRSTGPSIHYDYFNSFPRVALLV